MEKFRDDNSDTKFIMIKWAKLILAMNYDRVIDDDIILEMNSLWLLGCRPDLTTGCGVSGVSSLFQTRAFRDDCASRHRHRASSSCGLSSFSSCSQRWNWRLFLGIPGRRTITIKASSKIIIVCFIQQIGSTILI